MKNDSAHSTDKADYIFLHDAADVLQILAVKKSPGGPRVLLKVKTASGCHWAKALDRKHPRSAELAAEIAERRAEYSAVNPAVAEPVNTFAQEQAARIAEATQQLETLGPIVFAAVNLNRLSAINSRSSNIQWYEALYRSGKLECLKLVEPFLQSNPFPMGATPGQQVAHVREIITKHLAPVAETVAQAQVTAEPEQSKAQARVERFMADQLSVAGRATLERQATVKPSAAMVEGDKSFNRLSDQGAITDYGASMRIRIPARKKK